MCLSLNVNGNPRVIAAVNGPGYLSAHLNLRERPKDNDYSKSIRLAGIQTFETETMMLDGPNCLTITSVENIIRTASWFLPAP